MKKMMLLGVVVLTYMPLMAQTESRLKNKGDYQLSTNFGVEMSGVTTMSSVISVRDAASGLPTGKRMHKPFVITKELDKSTPLLFKAMTTHQVIPSMELGFNGVSPVAACAKTGYDVKPNVKGKVSLQDISITKIEKVSPTTEEVTIEYEAMTVTDSDGQTVCEERSTRPGQHKPGQLSK